MFDRLSDRLQTVFRNLTGRGSLTESNIEEAMRDVRRALLEADVHYTVAKDFVEQVRSECLGEKVLKNIAPGQMAVKIVHDHLVKLLGEADAPLNLESKPAVIMLIGLHGSGKTTTAAKLAHFLRGKLHKKVLLAACDLKRPAAIDQLEALGRELGIPVFARRDTQDVVAVAETARNQALGQGYDVLVLDTAGRLQIDGDLVQELASVRDRVQPAEILLVADAALGQQAVSVAEHFNQALAITGIILTKLDGDARGGAALSIRHVTGRPIKFAGVGERIPDLEAFHPDRLASRILGMGDIVSLVEKASEQFDEAEAKKLEEKMRANTFDFEDFQSQLNKIRKMGGVLSLLDMFPGAREIKEQVSLDEGQFHRIEGIINSMTVTERRKPELLNASRRRRVAAGSGVQLVEVNQLVKRFEMMRDMMAAMGKMSGGKPPPGGFGPPPGQGAPRLGRHPNPIMMKIRARGR